MDVSVLFAHPSKECHYVAVLQHDVLDLPEGNAGLRSAAPYGALLFVTLLASYVIDQARTKQV